MDKQIINMKCKVCSNRPLIKIGEHWYCGEHAVKLQNKFMEDRRKKIEIYEKQISEDTIKEQK